MVPSYRLRHCSEVTDGMGCKYPGWDPRTGALSALLGPPHTPLRVPESTACDGYSLSTVRWLGDSSAGSGPGRDAGTQTQGAGLGEAAAWAAQHPCLWNRDWAGDTARVGAAWDLGVSGSHSPSLCP